MKAENELDQFFDEVPTAAVAVPRRFSDGVIRVAENVDAQIPAADSSAPLSAAWKLIWFVVGSAVAIFGGSIAVAFLISSFDFATQMTIWSGIYIGFAIAELAVLVWIFWPVRKP